MSAKPPGWRALLRHFHPPAVYLYRDGRFHAELRCAAIRRAAQRLLTASAQDEP